MADEYESLAEKNELTYEEAIALKEEIQKRRESGQLAADVVLAPGKWHATPIRNAEIAVGFVNRDPAQGPGEVSMTNRPDGWVDCYWRFIGG